jgi:hypothetical protein
MKFITLALAVVPGLLAADQLTLTNDAEVALNESATLNAMHLLASSQKLTGTRLRGWIRVTDIDDRGLPK